MSDYKLEYLDIPGRDFFGPAGLARLDTGRIQPRPVLRDLVEILAAGMDEETKKDIASFKLSDKAKARMQAEGEKWAGMNDKYMPKDPVCSHQWISVKDRLPELGCSVLVSYGDKRMTVAWRQKTEGGFQWQQEVGNGDLYLAHGEGYSVTHWQPLPEPPK